MEGTHVNALEPRIGEPNIRPDCTDELTAALRQRIMVIDGAMGTAIQRDRPDEAGYRGERFSGVADRPSRQQRPAQPDPAADHRGDPPRVPRGGRRHPGDQHVQRERGLALGLRHARAGLRAELRRRCSGPQGRRRVQHPGEAPLRRRRPRPDDADRVDLAGRQRPRSPQRLLRPAGRRLPRRRQRPGRRWCRPPHRRDDLRFAELQGGGVRPRDAVRGTRAPLAGDHLGHHHRCVRADVVRSGHRSVLERDQARQADRGRPQLRAWRAGDEALHRRGGADRGHLRLLLSERRSAQRIRRVRRVPGGSGRLHQQSSPRPAWSTWSVVAAERRRRTSPRSPRSSRACRSASCPRSRWPPGSRAWSRSTSTTTRCS